MVVQLFPLKSFLNGLFVNVWVVKPIKTYLEKKNIPSCLCNLNCLLPLAVRHSVGRLIIILTMVSFVVFWYLFFS